MWRQFVLNLFHENKICEKICNRKYPWGWKSKDTILNYKKLLNNCKDNHLNIKETIVKKNLNEFNETCFLKGSILAYNVTYKAYLNNTNFLNYQYTNPKLSIALNEIRNNTPEDLLINLPNKIKVNNSIILSNVITNDFTTDNFKLFGYYNKDEVMHQILSGAIGPEITHIWDQLPVKQIINILYESDDYYDIIEWERDLTLEEPEWHISNINLII